MLKRHAYLTLTLAAAIGASGAQAADEYQAKAQKLIDTGLGYLQSQQQEDGGWQANEKMPPAFTALALRGFVQDDKYDTKSDLVKKGFNKLLSFQMEDGGIYKDLLANYNTAIAISTLTAAKDDAYKPQIDKAVTYLQKLQWTQDTVPEFTGKNEADPGKKVVKGSEDPFYGGWGYGGRSRGPGRADLSNAQFAVQALHDAGVAADSEVMKRALTFVSRCQNNSETNKADWASNDGGFIYGPSADRGGESFAGSYTDGSGKKRFHSMGTMTYAGLKSMVYAGVDKKDPRVRAAWSWVQSHFTVDGNGSEAGNKDFGLYYYYMTLAKCLNAFDEPVITLRDGGQVDWRVALVDKMGELQKADGSWVGINEEMENQPVLVTSYVVLALQDALEDLKQHPVR